MREGAAQSTTRAEPIKLKEASPSDSTGQIMPKPFEDASPRHVLPNDLPNAIRHLGDEDLDRLLAATLAEVNRRGRRLPIDKPSPQGNLAAASLTCGQLNAVRAAFKAGITPSRIARQFRISQSDVRKALASDVSPRKTD